MAFTGICPPAAVFGYETSLGMLAVKCVDVDAPAGIVLAVNAAGTLTYFFYWANTTGALRFVNCTIGTGTVAVYDPGTNQMTFTAFDQATSGAAV